MVATGTNYRLHTYNPDNLAILGPTVYEVTQTVMWLIPVKKVLRDTYINQYTWYVEIMCEPPELGEVTAEICLYRLDRGPLNPISVGTTYFSKVSNSTVTATTVFGVLIQTQWILDAPIHLEGGTYAWGILFDITLNRSAVLITLKGVTDADSNVLFPKWTISPGAVTLPATITGSMMTRNTTDWQYISGEWY